MRAFPLLIIVIALVCISGCSDRITIEEPEPVPHGTHQVFIHFIDVGQGNSALITYNGTSYIVDGGESNDGERIVEYLEYQGITRLNGVILSHPDADHVGGLGRVLETMIVDAFISNGEMKDSISYDAVADAIRYHDIPMINVSAGYTIRPDPNPEYTITVVNPPEKRFGDTNEDSVVLKITLDNKTALLMGDAGMEAERAIVESYPMDVDVLEVGHHGSKYSTSLEFLQTVEPEICIISVGDNSYGHPSEETLQRIRYYGTQYYRTDEDGDIVATLSPTTFSVKVV